MVARIAVGDIEEEYVQMTAKTPAGAGEKGRTGWGGGSWS
jgi:hypothetical protein